MSGAFARILLSVTGLALVAAIIAGGLLAVDRMAVSDRDAARRALLARDAALNRAELAPGSALACLDAGAGDTVEDACEKAIFHSAQSAAAAVAYMGARLKLLREAALLAKHGDPGIMHALAATRRAVGLDRFGVAAHVLASRDDCTAEKCPAFALVEDAAALKANLRAQVYDQYVSRYADQWNKTVAPPTAPAVSQAAPAPPVSVARATNGPLPAPIKPGEKWDFPSAASIPAVSIMNKEPPLPPGANAPAQVPPKKPHETTTAQANKPVPMPPKAPRPSPPLSVTPPAPAAPVQAR